jgi:GH25 family lysozyme M1 (1,4-beta-N-acetylmuramidase)
MLWIVDAHTEYQQSLRVSGLRSEGYSAIIVKATQGVGYTAPGTFDDWISDARNSGLIPGAYHWLDNSDPIEQVNHYLNRVGNVEGMLCAVDVEDPQYPPSRSTLVDFANEFYRKTGGHPLIIYSGAWWWQPRGWDGASVSPYLWDSHYVNGSGFASELYSNVPDSWWAGRYGNWDEATILQFSSSGSAGGIRANVDISAFRGTEYELLSLAYSDINAVPSIQGEEVKMFMAKTATDATVVLSDGATWCDPLDSTTFNSIRFIPLADGVSDAYMAKLRKLPTSPAGVALTDAQAAALADAVARAVGAGTHAVDAAQLQAAVEAALAKVKFTVN